MYERIEPCAVLYDDEDFEWEPPTAAEMKVIQARRERQDKISKIMGDYLLKGYKMLGECCDICGTILLQDKQQKNYCVSCQELDSDIDKDNPALNAQAALSQVRERQLSSQPPQPEPNGGPSGIQASGSVPLPRPEHCEGAAAGLRGALLPAPPPAPSTVAVSTAVATPALPSAPAPQVSVQQPVLREAEEAILTKLRWASCQLQTSASLEASIQLCSLITSCAKSLQSLRELSQ
ncbi:Sjoegren syndrome/scleroderma autoantigen 1 [Merluccius polli]|uniref:Sjoegren syndrome/scleroderma autoantigen 1 n=1 Tax=Merluccius polli TaxID=89951 RepID=A0AA47MRY4_MERPO|nr:Sjoegren syndrome/scleroderma autoantigen 1 [Merluccius polli]